MFVRAGDTALRKCSDGVRGGYCGEAASAAKVEVPVTAGYHIGGTHQNMNSLLLCKINYPKQQLRCFFLFFSFSFCPPLPLPSSRLSQFETMYIHKWWWFVIHNTFFRLSSFCYVFVRPFYPGFASAGRAPRRTTTPPWKKGRPPTRSSSQPSPNSLCPRCVSVSGGVFIWYLVDVVLVLFIHKLA